MLHHLSIHKYCMNGFQVYSQKNSHLAEYLHNDDSIGPAIRIQHKLATDTWGITCLIQKISDSWFLKNAALSLDDSNRSLLLLEPPKYLLRHLFASTISQFTSIVWRVLKCIHKGIHIWQNSHRDQCPIDPAYADCQSWLELSRNHFAPCHSYNLVGKCFSAMDLTSMCLFHLCSHTHVT